MAIRQVQERMEKLEERCLFYYTHKDAKGQTGFSLRKYDCARCLGYYKDCKIYLGTKI